MEGQSRSTWCTFAPDDGDPGLEAEVLRMFLTQARTCLEAWKRAESEAGRKEAAHALKGSARAIGAFGSQITLHPRRRG